MLPGVCPGVCRTPSSTPLQATASPSCTKCSIDPRVGGRYRVRFRMLDGSEHESSGEYLEVVRPERLAMSWRWAGGEEDPGESLVEIELRAIPEGTELTFTHSRLRDEATRRSHEEGWNGAFDKLERHFNAIDGELR